MTRLPRRISPAALRTPELPLGTGKLDLVVDQLQFASKTLKNGEVRELSDRHELRGCMKLLKSDQLFYRV
jgi:hypothetical protein